MEYWRTILHDVLYVCGTWSLSQREEVSLRVFEKTRLLRKIFGPNWNEATSEWRKLLMRSLMISIPLPLFVG
jgi:hypothetical protein